MEDAAVISSDPPDRAARAAAVDKESCSTRVRKKTDEEATSNGFISEKLGMDKAGTTESHSSVVFAAAVGRRPASTERNKPALIHSAVVVAMAAPIGPNPDQTISSKSSTRLITLAKINTNMGVFVSR